MMSPIMKYLRALFAQIGSPYVWAEINPMGPKGGPGSGFDCSGLTAWAAQKAGVNLAHHAATQYSTLPHVAASHLQPGDLVFFSYGRLGAGVADHVGVYIGDGKMIAASSSADKVAVQTVDWSHFIGGGSINQQVSGDPVDYGAVKKIAQGFGVNLSAVSASNPVTSGTGSAVGGSGTAGALSGLNAGGGLFTKNDLNDVLQGYGLKPALFSGLIDQAIREDWSDTHFLAMIYQSEPFQKSFPGIMRDDGSLKMTPFEYLQLSDQYKHIAEDYGINMSRQRIGMNIAGDVSPDEFNDRALIFRAYQRTPELRAQVDAILSHNQQAKLDNVGYYKWLAGKSQGQVVDLYEAARLQQQGLDLGPHPLAVARALGTTGQITDTAALAAQVKQVSDFVGPELAAAGITQADLTLLEGGAPDEKNISSSLQQILRNRQALSGAAASTGGSVAGGLFGAAAEGR